MTFEVHAQLGFCTGNSGDPIITQDFDTGTSHIDLPFGTTNYDPVFGFPLDGQYTVLNGTFGNGFDWHETQDHTPGDTNGKCLIVNAAAAPGEFYTITINDLCPDTTYEFSAWVINLVEAGAFCGSGAIPINVRFEIDINGTIVSGNTGNIVETATPIWKEYGLVFNTGSETSVILRMINNGAGGCGNDLAIDDIEFKTCGDLTIVEDASANTNINICSNQTPYATILTAVPDNSVFSTHFYQWQESSDGIIWNDIVGETSQNISISGVISTMFYRSKVSESMTTVNEPLCNTLSDIYQVTVNSLPSAPTTECWETANINTTTCLWEVTGTQPVQPTIDCWETAIFNDTTCLWEVTGAQPVKPTTDCWETATFNDTTCLWGLTGVKPIQPTTACWETATFNDTTCLWGLTGEQPAEPPLVDCWDNYVFNTTTCVWDNTGSQPIQPIIDSVVSNGNDIIISTTNTGDFIYSLDGNIFQDNNTFYNVEGALYTVYVKEINCNNIASIQHLHFIIPKFFTPNNDGFNDMFTLTGIEFFSSSEVSIFNRYGKLLKYSRNNPFSWNGTFNNQKLPTNDYWYIIIIDGQKFTGYFTLKR